MLEQSEEGVEEMCVWMCVCKRCQEGQVRVMLGHIS